MKVKTGFKLLALQIIFISACTNVTKDIGIFVANQDIGACAIEGEMKYDVEDDVYVLSGSGENIWFGKDQFHYAWFKSSGDITVRAKIEFTGEGKNAHRKAGWMFRNELDSTSAHISATIHGDGLTGLQYRQAKGEEMQEVKSMANDPQYFEMQKSGDEFKMVTWSQEGRTDTVFFNADLLNDAYYVGLFICSHDNSVRESVKFSKVEVWSGGEEIPPYEVGH
ncbi:MAG: hypothetical protein WD052_11590 [Bacteroidales bacterium]